MLNLQFIQMQTICLCVRELTGEDKMQQKNLFHDNVRAVWFNNGSLDFLKIFFPV